MDTSIIRIQLPYVPQKAVKGQVIVDFLAEPHESQEELINIPVSLVVASIWILSSKTQSGKEEWIQ